MQHHRDLLTITGFASFAEKLRASTRGGRLSEAELKQGGNGFALLPTHNGSFVSILTLRSCRPDVTPFTDEHLQGRSRPRMLPLIHEGGIILGQHLLWAIDGYVQSQPRVRESLCVAVETCLHVIMGMPRSRVHKVASFITPLVGQRHTVHLFEQRDIF
jgi:hypothetical protein